MRAEAGIPEGAIVILYMARLTRDKGALNMAHAFRPAGPPSPRKVHIMIVAVHEEQLIPSIKRSVEIAWARPFRMIAQQFRKISWWLRTSCVCRFPRRFGTVLINAAAAGIPAVAARIYGSEDAVVDGETGLLHVVGDPDDVADKLRMLIDDPALRARLGQRGVDRVAREFSEEMITSELLTMYRVCIQGISRKNGA